MIVSECELCWKWEEEMWKVFKTDKRFKKRSERCPIYLKSELGCKNFKEFIYKINRKIVSREAFMEGKDVRSKT